VGFSCLGPQQQVTVNCAYAPLAASPQSPLAVGQSWLAIEAGIEAL